MAVAIYLGSTYLIHSALTPAQPEETTKFERESERANSDRFCSLLKEGKKALGNRQFSMAADSFHEAERSVDRLSEAQYESLRQAYLQLIEAYKSNGAEKDAQATYRVLIQATIRDGDALINSKHYESALKRGHDAEDLCRRLNPPDVASNKGAISLSVTALSVLKRYSEAEAEQQRLIDSLKTNGESSQEDLAQNYWTLAFIDSDGKDWQGARQAFEQGIDSADAALAGQTEAGGLRIFRNSAQYNLVIASYQEGDVSAALSKAQDFYNEYSGTPQSTNPANLAHPADDFAGLALQIARETNRQDDVAYWGQRAPGGIKVVAIHPFQRP